MVSEGALCAVQAENLPRRASKSLISPNLDQKRAMRMGKGSHRPILAVDAIKPLVIRMSDLDKGEACEPRCRQAEQRSRFAFVHEGYRNHADSPMAGLLP